MALTRGSSGHSRKSSAGLSLTGRSLTAYSCANTTRTASEYGAILYPELATQNDVVDAFLDELLDIIIEDFEVKPYAPSSTALKPAMVTSATSVKTTDYKSLSHEDLKDSTVVGVSGTSVTMLKKRRNSNGRLSVTSIGKSEKSSSTKSRLSFAASVSGKVSSQTTQSSAKRRTKLVRIVYTNGNVFEGESVKNLMHGRGTFTWADGSVYEGDFENGYASGAGSITLPDLSHYDGHFRRGHFHKEGVLNAVATPLIYSGQWKDGKKHGQGWLLYDSNDWYEGQWSEDQRQGFGVRRYKQGGCYKGYWNEDSFDDSGALVWMNGDYYKGTWMDGLPDGYGHYIWRASFNDKFAFAQRNAYKGFWSAGKRNGEGTMYIGSGAKLEGVWRHDFKHGDFRVVCGNGLVVQTTFHRDKPLPKDPPAFISLFTVAELVDVTYYINKLLEGNIEEASDNLDKLSIVEGIETKRVAAIIAQNLPVLQQLYHNYATLGVENPQELGFKPVLIRMFLWQLWRDVDITTSRGLSLVDIDDILAENPGSCVETKHGPFEMLQFWQFLMSLAGVALTTRSLEDVVESETERSVSAVILKQFFKDDIFGKLPPRKGTYPFRFKNLVPIKDVYSLYLELGEPHSAKTFLRRTCLKKGEEPPCYFERTPDTSKPTTSGENCAPFFDDIEFLPTAPTTSSSESTQNFSKTEEPIWKGLLDFYKIKPRNVLKCLVEACPLMVQEGKLCKIEYPLTFLEFYDALLACIFVVIERELGQELKVLKARDLLKKAETGTMGSGSQFSKKGSKSHRSSKSSKSIRSNVSVK